MKTVRTGKLGDLTLRLVEKDRAFIGVIFGGDNLKKAQVEGEDADTVWRQLHDEAGKANPKYFGYEGARTRFLHFFKGGFLCSSYAEAERDYKLAAKKRLDDIAPLDQAKSGAGFGEKVLAVFNATNLLSPFEKMRVRDLLRGPAADDFVRASARFALGEGASALRDIERALKQHEAATWAVATYLPFLWRPDRHMFLKPTVTKEFAERVGHRFADAYEPKLGIVVYEGLLDLVSETEAELVTLGPKDRIDVQSFIWIIGRYKNDGLVAR
jgi:hypothetical protein